MDDMANTIHPSINLADIRKCYILNLKCLRAMVTVACIDGIISQNGWRSQLFPIERISNLTLPIGRLVCSPTGCGAHGRGVIGV